MAIPPIAQAAPAQAALRRIRQGNELGRCPMCRVGLTNKNVAILAHEDLGNPDGPYIHPIHKRCLLSAYKVNGDARCCICRVDLNIEPILPIGERNLEVMIVRPDTDTDVMNQVARALVQSLSVPVGHMVGNCKYLDDWVPNGRTAVALLGGALALAHIGILLREHRMQNIWNNAVDMYPSIIFCLVTQKNSWLVGGGMALLCLGGSKFMPCEQFRSASRGFIEMLDQAAHLLRKELLFGVAVGLSTQGITANIEDEQTQKALTSAILVSAVSVFAIAKGIWRGTHPNRE